MAGPNACLYAAKLIMPYNWHKVAHKCEVWKSKIQRLLLHTKPEGCNVNNNKDNAAMQAKHLCACEAKRADSASKL